MIEDFYVPGFSLYTKTRAKNDSGVVKETLVKSKDFEGILDPNPTSYQFISLKERYNFTDALYCSVDVGIAEDNIVSYDGNNWSVVSVINPLHRDNHLEVLLERKR